MGQSVINFVPKVIVSPTVMFSFKSAVHALGVCVYNL